MSIRSRAAQFFRNVADYLAPPAKESHLINSHALSTITDPTIYNQNVEALRRDLDMEEVFRQLKGKEKTPTI